MGYNVAGLYVFLDLSSIRIDTFISLFSRSQAHITNLTNRDSKKKKVMLLKVPLKKGRKNPPEFLYYNHR